MTVRNQTNHKPIILLMVITVSDDDYFPSYEVQPNTNTIS